MILRINSSTYQEINFRTVKMMVKKASITIRNGSSSTSSVALSEGPFLIGRGARSDFVLDEATVSSRHALVIATEEGYILRDLDTETGTFVNGCRVSRFGHMLRDNDTIRLGESVSDLLFLEEVS